MKTAIERHREMRALSSVRRSANSLARKILRLAESGPVGVALIAQETGATRVYAGQELSKLTRDGFLERIELRPARYALKPGVRPEAAEPAPSARVPPARGMAAVNRNHAYVAEGMRRTFAEQLAAAEEWLRDCPRLPPARPPAFHERGMRRAYRSGATTTQSRRAGNPPFPSAASSAALSGEGLDLYSEE